MTPDRETMDADESLLAEFVLREHKNRQLMIDAVRKSPIGPRSVIFHIFGAIPILGFVFLLVFLRDDVTALTIVVAGGLLGVAGIARTQIMLVDKRIDALISLLDLEKKDSPEA